MRIAYLANSDDLLHGADRRRFVYFAKKEKSNGSFGIVLIE